MPDIDWGSGGKGALSGAAAGAAIGSAVPGVGTALGAGVGGVAGFFLNGGVKDGKSDLGYGNPYANLGPYPNPTLATVNPAVTPDASMYNPNYGSVNDSIAALRQFAGAPGVGVDQAASQNSAAQQQSLINMLQGSAAGTGGPSAAQQQMNQGLDQSLAQSRALTQSMGGANPIAALQAGGAQQELLQRQAIGQSALLRAQEQLSARDQLGGALASQRSGNIADTGQQLQAGMFNRQTQESALNSVLGGNTNVARMTQQGNQAYDQARMAGQSEYNRQTLQNQWTYNDQVINARAAARNELVNSRSAELNSQRQYVSTLLQTGGALGAAYLSSQRGGSGTPAPGSQGAVDAYSAKQLPLSGGDSSSSPSVGDFTSNPGGYTSGGTP